MSTIGNDPDAVGGGPVGGGALVQGRLSDLALSIHDPASDLVLPVLNSQDWDEIDKAGDRPALLEAVVAAQSALLAQTTRKRQKSDYYKGFGLAAQEFFNDESLKVLDRLFPGVTGKEIFRVATAKAPELQKELVALTARKSPLSDTLNASAAVGSRLRKRFQNGQMPSAMDLRTAWWSVADQGAAAGCVGYAVSGLLHRQQGSRLEIPSARFIWQAAKELDGEKRPTTMIAGAGTSLRAALSLVREYGYALENELPSDSAKLYPGGLDTFYSTIKNRDIHSFVNLGNDIKNRLAWLSLGRPIVCSLRVGPDFIGATGSDRIPLTDTTAENQIAHAAVIVGYRFNPKKEKEREPKAERTIAQVVKDFDERRTEQTRAAGGKTNPAVKTPYDDLPFDYLIRNSAGLGWGDRGYAWFAHVDLFKLLMEEYGVFCSKQDLDEASDPDLIAHGKRRTLS
jgi:hypothetical protein